MRSLALRASLAIAGLVCVAGNADARKHPLQRIGDDSVDLVMSVDWDFDAPGAAGGGRDYLEPALRTFAKSTFQMTEGRLRICKVYVYNEGRHASFADIVAAPVGRASAVLGALRSSHGQIRMFLGLPGRPYSSKEFGNVLAHEFGHYGLFLKDEYHEPHSAEQDEPEYLKPRVCDVRMFTMMGTSGSFIELSMPADYTKKEHDAWGLGPTLQGTNPTKQEKYRHCNKLVAPVEGAPQEDATWRTAHWRTYQMSAWELITEGPARERLHSEYRDRSPVVRFPSIEKPGMPERLSNPLPDYDGACFQAIFMDGAFAVLVIDRSLSMQDAHPISGTNFDHALAAAKTYVASAPAETTVAILEYAAEVGVILEPTRLAAETLAAQRSSIIAKIDAMKAVPPAGNTGLDGALTKAIELLAKGAAVGNAQFIVTISDGEVLLSDSMVPALRSVGAAVFTRAVASDTSATLLQKLSRETGGAHQSGQDWTHGMIEDFLRLREPVGLRTFPKPGDSAPLEEPVQIGELDGETAFRAQWSALDAAAFELVMPDGTLVTPSSVPAGVSYESMPGGAIYRVPAPAVGEWKTRVVPLSPATNDFHVDARSDSPLRLDVAITGDGEYPTPWFVRATLSAPQPVVGANLKGILTRTKPISSEPPDEISFFDDGVAPDESANDGVYTAVVAHIVEDGDFELEVIAQNPGGARVDSDGVGDDPEGGPEPALPLSAFTRRSTHLLEATGHREMPQSPEEGPIPIVQNDLTPVWVTINEPGDVVWLAFNGYYGGYTAMTGYFIPQDGKPMTTRLTLYDFDGTTPLAESAEPDGRAMVTLHDVKEDNRIHYLKVEHTGGGIGRLAVGLAPKSWFEEKGSSGGSSDSGGCSIPGGRSRAIGAWLLLALSAAIGLRRRAA